MRVNVPPADMSVRYGDPGHFERWLDAWDTRDAGEDVDCWSGARFVPRTVFGDYLEHTAGVALARLRQHGWRINLVRAGVKAAVRTDDRVVLVTEHGKHRAVDYAVLCVGGGRPQDAYGLSGTRNYIEEPYPVSRTLNGLGIDDHVAITGSGLTAIDVVVALVARGHRGRISLLSRRGALPGVRQRPVPYELRLFTAERFRRLAMHDKTVTVDDLVALMRAELAGAGEQLAEIIDEVAGVEAEQPITRLRRQLDSVNAPHLGLRILQHAVAETGPDVWPLLSERDKVKLLRTHYRTIMSLCCPMSSASATTLLRLIDSGQLDIVADLQRIEPLRKDGFRIVTAHGELTAEHVINAMGAPSHRIPTMAAPLVTSLLTGRAASCHPHGGLHVERATSRLTVEGNADPRLYALGDLAAGTLFFTFGIPSLVDRSHDIVHAIRSDLARSLVSQTTGVFQSPQRSPAPDRHLDERNEKAL
ncbi:putative NAD(P)/FAD-binding protein YdhS [Streptomyces sp. V1I1]|nr:putative NAD(P)/FAD-binding protein YdhS [Streptomyces sp. V1I1]